MKIKGLEKRILNLGKKILFTSLLLPMLYSSPASAKSLEHHRKLAWDRVHDSRITSYDVEFCKNDGAPTIYNVGLDVCDDQQCKWEFPENEPNNEYTMRVRSVINPTLHSPWSAWKKYVVGSDVGPDTTPPILNSLEYPDKTNQTFFHLSGYASDENHFDVLVKDGMSDEKIIINQGEGNFSYDINLTEGENLIQILAEDVFGDRRWQWISVDRDTIPPDLRLTEYPIKTSVPDVYLKGTHGDANVSELDITGDIEIPSYFILNRPQDWESYVTLLNEGINNIMITDTDDHGNRTVKNITIESDYTKPMFSVEAPASDKTGTGTIHMTGTMSDLHTPQLMVSGDATLENIIRNNDSWEADVRFPSQGWNEFQIYAQDSFGNASESQIFNVFNDTEAPVLSLDDYTSVSLKKDRILTGTLDDISSASLLITVNGAPVDFTFFGNQWRSEIVLEEGDNVIELYSEDEFGHQRSNSIDINYDPNHEASPPVKDSSFTLDNCLDQDVEVYLEGQFIGSNPLVDDQLKINLPLSKIADQDVQLDFHTEEGVFRGLYEMRKGFETLDDFEGESLDRWTNQAYLEYVSNHTEGDQALKFDLSGIAPGGSRSWYFTIPEGYNTQDIIDYMVDIYKGSEKDMEFVFFLHSENSWLGFSPEIKDLEWSEARMPLHDGTLYGSVFDPKNPDMIKVRIYNRDNTTFTDDYVILDKMVGFKGVPVVDISNYADDIEVQDDWVSKRSALLPYLDEDGEGIVLPADTSYDRAIWDNPGEFDLSVGSAVRVIVDSLNETDDNRMLLYFKNNLGTYFYIDERIVPGINDITYKKEDFHLINNQINGYKDIDMIRYSTNQIDGHGNPFSDVVLKSILFNDLYTLKKKD